MVFKQNPLSFWLAIMALVSSVYRLVVTESPKVPGTLWWVAMIILSGIILYQVVEDWTD